MHASGEARRWVSLVAAVGVISAVGCRQNSDGDVEKITTKSSAIIVTDDLWFPVGPSPIGNGIVDSPQVGGGIAGGTQSGVETSGRASALILNPQNPLNVYAGLAGGGVWTTTFGNDLNAATEWQLIFDAFPAVGAIEPDPTSCDATLCSHLWIGTGEGKLRRQTLYGVGIYDIQQGESGYDALLVPGSDAFSGGSINDIILEPAAGSTDTRLFATVMMGNSSSAHAAIVTHPPPASGYGVFRWDGGSATTWVREDVPFGAPSNRYTPGDLRRITTTQGKALYVGFTNRGIYRRFLTGSSAGTTWCPLNPGVPVPSGCATPVATCPGTGGAPCGLPAPGPDASPAFDRISLAQAPSNNNTIYASFPNCAFTYTSMDRTSAGGTGCPLVLFRSTDGGTSWANTQATAVGQSGSQAAVGGSQIEAYNWYTGTLAVNQLNANEVYFGGVGFWRSTNSGTNFTLIGVDTHPDVHAIVPTGLSLGAGQLVFLAHDGGISVTSTSGDTGSATRNGYPATQFYSMAVHELVTCVDQTGRDDDCDGTTTDDGTECQPGNSNTCNTQNALGGAQDNGTVLFNGGRTWTTVGGGDGGDAILQDSQVNFQSVQATATNPQRFTGNGGITLSGLGALRNSQNPNGEGKVFQPPLIQHAATGTVFAGTDRVYQLNPGATTFTDISGPLGPALATCTGQSAGTPQGNCANGAMCVGGTCRPYFPDIEQTTAVSALAVARTDVSRLYAGLYNGSVFSRSGGTWTQILAPERTCDASVFQRPHIPGALEAAGQLRCVPVTSLEVDPADPNIVYATFGGFGIPGRHVRVFQGGSWSNFSDGDLSGQDVPAQVIRINATTPTEMFVGTDDGIFKRKTGTAWVRGPGFPHVPVYAIAIDGTRGKTLAATHGRGAYMQVKKPVLHLFEGWMPSRDCGGTNAPCIWDILVYGEGFQATGGTQPCRVDILTPTGAVCATGTFDGYSKNPITVDDQNGLLTTAGQLVSRDSENRAVIAVCFNGACVSDTKGSPTPIASCLPNAANPTRTIAAVQVTCPNNIPVVASVSAECPSLVNPPVANWSPAPFTDAAPGAPLTAPSTTTTTLTLSAIMVGDPPSSLCSVTIPYTPAEPRNTTMVRARDAFNASAACQQAGVTATLPAATESTIEDPIEGGGPLQLRAPNLRGMAVMPAISMDPGTTGTCQEIGLPGYGQNQLDIIDTAITTLASGALGGKFVFRETSPLGTCAISVPTLPGDTGIAIANRVLTEYLAAADNRLHPTCPLMTNPNDLIIRNNALVTIASTRTTVCWNDPGVGILIKPDGSTPIDANLGSIGILGSDGVTLRDRAQARAAGGAFATIGASGALGVSMLPDTQSGDVLSVGTVTLRDRAHVHGRVKTGQTVVRINGPIIDGAVVEHTQVALPSIAGFLITFPTTAGPDVTVPVNGQDSRAPGIYGRVTMFSGSRLTLRSGDYFFRSLDVEPSSILRLDQANGPVRIYVRDSVIFRGAQQTLTGAAPTGFIAYQGTVDTVIESSYRGTFAAPRAKLTLRSVAAQHFGAFFARIVELDANTIVNVVPFTGTVPGSQQAAATCTNGIRDGNETGVDCGGSCGPTCQGGQGCATASDCASQVCTNGLCQAGCVASAAIDLGRAGNSTTVKNDACVRVKDAYPAGWGRRNMNLETTLGGTYPVPFVWSNTCVPASGTGQFTGDGQRQTFGLTDAQCATVIDLQGSGNGTVTLKYSAGN